MADVYSKKLNPHSHNGIDYAEFKQIGNTKIYSVFPDITEEERLKRLRITLDCVAQMHFKTTGVKIKFNIWKGKTDEYTATRKRQHQGLDFKCYFAKFTLFYFDYNSKTGTKFLK